MKLIQKSFSVCKVDDVDQKGRVIIAANAFDNMDADGDISAVGSYQKTLKENFSRVRWFHNHNKNILLGVPIEGVEAYPFLKMTGQLNMEKEVSRDVYSDYKLFAQFGKSLEHSVGVNPVLRDTKDKRIVKEWKMWEYSTLSSWGANPNTPMLGIKSDTELAETIDWMMIILEKGDHTDEYKKKVEKQISILRSLAIEPEPDGATTQKDKPDEKGLLIALKEYNQQLSIKNTFKTWTP